MSSWEEEKEELRKLALAIKGSTKEEFPAELANLENYIYKTYRKENRPMNIKEGLFCEGANFDCDKPYISVADPSKSVFSKSEKIEIPESMAYYLRTHWCGSQKMHDLIQKNAKQEIQNKLKEILGVE